MFWVDLKNTKIFFAVLLRPKIDDSPNKGEIPFTSFIQCVLLVSIHSKLSAVDDGLP